MQNVNLNCDPGVPKPRTNIHEFPMTPNFQPAFCDSDSGQIYLSRFADGALAPLHLFDSLPDALILQRDPRGRVTALKSTVTAGFVQAGVFYTRTQAALASGNHR